MMLFDTTVIRPLQSSQEVHEYCLMAAEALFPGPDLEYAASTWDAFTSQNPGFHEEQRRGIFDGDRLLGGYVISEVFLRSGKALLKTGCIGSVVTRHDLRCQGIATKLMTEAITYAKQLGYPLLLLQGITRFYRRFGYTNVFHPTEHAISCEYILAQPPSPYSVREATFADASTILALYERHFCTYTGNFVRTLAKQEHYFHFRLPYNPTFLVLDTANQPCGYIIFPNQQEFASATEVVADSWPAALALLQYQASRLKETSGSLAEVCWPLPTDSHTFYLLSDDITVRDKSYDWGVHSKTLQRLNIGWLARAASLPALIRALLPQWEEQLQRFGTNWSGAFTLEVDDESCMLEVVGSTLSLHESKNKPPLKAVFTSQAFVQLLFGYRTISWACSQSHLIIPGEIVALFNTFFRNNHPWITESDSF